MSSIIFSIIDPALVPDFKRFEMNTLERLIEDASKLDEIASGIQSGKECGLSEEEIRKFVELYYSWYAECLNALPDDLKEKFRQEYEGTGRWYSLPKIKKFLESPTQVNILHNNQEGNPFSYWTYPSKDAFSAPILAQKQILIEASKRQPQRAAQRPAEKRIFDLREFHSEVRKHGQKSFVEDRYFNAVFECCKAFDRYVAQKAQSKESGTKLMQSVLAPNNNGKGLRLNALQTETEKNEQVGLLNLCVGLISMARNPGGHEPELDYPMTREDALDLLSFISFLYRQIDKTSYVS